MSTVFHNTREANVANSDRSPFLNVTCPEIGYSLNFSIACAKPFEVSLTYTLSICSTSPVRTIFVPSPIRVMIVLTSCLVKFCASSITIKAFAIERPRIYVRASSSILPFYIYISKLVLSPIKNFKLS